MSYTSAGFASGFFHHPDELNAELAEAGLPAERVLGVIGPAWMARGFDESWQDEGRRETILAVAHMLEDEPVLSPRIMAVARRPGDPSAQASRAADAKPCR